VADIAPKKASAVATLTTAVVVPDTLTIVPMHMERMNWARKTILETMATSVPKPLICCCDCPSWYSSNYEKMCLNSNFLIEKICRFAYIKLFQKQVNLKLRLCQLWPRLPSLKWVMKVILNILDFWKLFLLQTFETKALPVMTAFTRF